MRKIKLYPHQIQALKETEKFSRVGYFLDMGLGKTFVGSEKLNQLDAPYNLLICQKSKIDDWYDHFKSYYDYKVIKYNKAQEISRHSVVIINYDLIWRRPELMKLKDFTLMCDESSMIKNEKSERAKFILKMKAKNIILLSGTPTGGKYEQLWSQCKLLGWKISKKLYWQEFIKSVLLDIGGFKIKKVTGYKNVDRLKRKLHEYGAVFMKTDEVFELPEQIEQKIKIKNTKEYKIFKKDRLITINNTELVGDTSLTKMLYLRQLSSQYNKNKVNQLKDILESTEDRIIIFYNFNKELEIIKKLCEKLDKPISIINGAVKDLDNFNQYNNSITLVQYQAGAMGHNLQKSNKIIYFSLPLQSELFEQSKKRIHRIGQEKTCFYWYLITQNSIEEQIYQTLKERRDYTNKLFEESDF
ncbi:SNF2-related protein [Clostridium tyrobutyricum]|uniref:SNF2-related protein n=1 Tax=Clostridium tyrobutyricum TaxID=1519 RepID=UPI0034A0BB60